MRNEEVFAIWAPDTSPWSVWAKPVCFAHGPGGAVPSVSAGTLVNSSSPDDPRSWRGLPLTWVPPPADTAIVVDLPGEVAVGYGLALAERGYRPVPLFNACSGTSEIVPMSRLIELLFLGTDELQAAGVPDSAPPAFLLDANRLEGAKELRPGRFDNRWMVFPQDFPSANFLHAHGIQQVLVVKPSVKAMADDLGHVLLRWQEAGLILREVDALVGQTPQDVTVRRPTNFRLAMYRAFALFGLRRNSAGGFGSIIPQPSQG